MVDFVADVLHQQIADFDFKLNNCNNVKDDFHEKLLKSLEKKLADLNAKEISLWESQVDPSPEKRMPPHIFQALTDKLIKEREDTEVAIVKAKEAINRPIDYATKRATFQEALDALLDDKKSVSEKNHLLKKCIDKIVYQRDMPQRVTGVGVARQYTSPPIKLDIKLKV